MNLHSDVLTEIQRLTAVMKWRKANFHIIYFETNPDKTIGAPVYTTGREIAGEDFLVAIAMLEAILDLFGMQVLEALEDSTPYADLIIQERPITPLQPILPQIDLATLGSLMQFAGVLRYRKNVYHVRYEGDDGQGNPTNEFFEHPGGFSAGIDTLLLASMLETLGTHMGGEIVEPQQMPLDRSYADYYAAVDALINEAAMTEGSTIITPGELPAVSLMVAATRLPQDTLIELADEIRQNLPRYADLSSEEIHDLKRVLAPAMVEFLAIIDPLTE